MLLGRIAAGRKPNVQSPDQRRGALDAFRMRDQDQQTRANSAYRFGLPQNRGTQQIRKIVHWGIVASPITISL